MNQTAVPAPVYVGRYAWRDMEIRRHVARVTSSIAMHER
jgi:hypothetical protein